MKDNIADNPKTDIKFDTERFIAEIKRRPIIYDNASKNFHDRDLKMVAWNDVCESMIPKWDLLSHEEKQAEEKYLKGRWRNIKDYYIKELKLQRKTNDTLGGRKRRKCDERFDQLKFLLPSIENKTSRIQLYQNGDLDQALELDNPITQEPETSQEDLYEDCVITERIEEPEMVTYRYLMSETPEEEPASMDEAEAPVSDTDEVTQLASPVADEDGSRSLEDDDYDRMFLLSLLPIMRRVPETKKLDVRIQMQQLLARAIRSRAKKK